MELRFVLLRNNSVVQQMVAHQHPLPRAPGEAGSAKALSRAITVACISPARKASYGHTSGHGPHRFRHPTELARGGGIEALASPSSNRNNIWHGRLLLV